MPGTEQRKTYILDTSVLLAAGKQPLTAFEEHQVVVPLVVVQELESKRDDPDLGLTARSALRELERLRVEYGSDLSTGVPVTSQVGTLRIESNHIDSTNKVLRTIQSHARSHDARILTVAFNLQQELGDGHQVIVVSNDLPMRLLSEGVLGIPAQEYQKGAVSSDGYTGVSEVHVTDDEVDLLYANKRLTSPERLPANSGVILRGASNSALTVTSRDGQLLELVDAGRDVFGVSGKSAEQRIALAHLMNPSVKIVSLGGPAGTGKTLLALAAGLEQVLERDTYKRVVVFRNVHAVGQQELGYLPGSEEEKMDPWAAAIHDALEAFVDRTVREEIAQRNLIEVRPLTHIRGRTLVDSLVIVDEAQNLERATILTALSRLGQGSKAVLSWDVSQRDNLRVGRHDGVHAVVQKLKGEALFAHTSLIKSERSDVAELVSRVLDDMEV